MAILNPNFANPGLSAGLAANWTLSASTALESIAGFGATPEFPREDFERWHDFVADFSALPQVRAFFVGASLGYEAFEQGWSNTHYFAEFNDAQLEYAAFSPSNVEGFESAWSNATFLRDWIDVTADGGQFDGESFEDFEERWRGNEAFMRDWALVAAFQATFDGGANARESFEGTWSQATTQ